MSAGATAAASAAAAIAQAVKASGILVNVTPNDFAMILNKVKEPLIVYSQHKFLKIVHQYMVAYKGFVFYTKAHEEMILPSKAEVIHAKKIWIPG